MWAAHAAWASFGVIAFCQTQPARLSEEAHDCKCHKFSHHTVVDRRILIKLCWLGQCATHMITHVITSQQLGGYTERTFPAAIDGHRVNQVTFTKFILRIIGISFLFGPWKSRNVLTLWLYTGKANIFRYKWCADVSAHHLRYPFGASEVSWRQTFFFIVFKLPAADVEESRRMIDVVRCCLKYG